MLGCFLFCNYTVLLETYTNAKANEYHGHNLEEITEVYLMKEQVENLIISPSNYPIMRKTN